MPTHRGPRRIAPLWLFLVLWLVGTFYFAGDLGKWLDDWGAHVRSPEGGFRWKDVFALDYFNHGFWRPLHIRFVVGLQTVFWHHDWIIHLITALFHALNTFLLWKVLRRLCLKPQAAALGSLLFLTYPAGYEAVFWLSTLGTTAGLTHLLVCTLAVQRYAAGEISAKHLALFLPVLLLVPWWYEQPAAAAPAMCMAYLACASPRAPLRRRLGVAAIIAVIGVASAAFYMLLMKATAYPGVRGSDESFASPGQVVSQAVLIVQQAWGHLSLHNFAAGAIEEGWRAFWSKPRRAIVTIAALAFALLTFARWWLLADSTPASSTHKPPVAGFDDHTLFQRASGVLFGVALLCGSIVPIILIKNQWFSSRLTYLPVLALAMVLATLIDAVWIRASTTKSPARGPLFLGGIALRCTTLATLLAIAAVGTIMFVGVQSAWHHGARRDALVAQRLRQAIPNPPDNALFIPTRITGWPVRTKTATFELIGSGPMEAIWCAPHFIRMSFARNNLVSTAFNRWVDPKDGLIRILGGTPEGLVVESTLFQYIANIDVPKEPTRLVPWDKVVAFELEVDQVRMVSAFEFHGPNGELLRVDLTAPQRGGGPAPMGPPARIRAYGGK